MRVSLLAALGLAVFSSPAFAAAAPATGAEKTRVTVAVAPFVTPSDSEYRWVSLGLAHALVSQLLEIKELNTLTIRQVNSAVRKDNLRPEDLNDEKIAQHLGVQLGSDYVIMGSFTAEWPELTLVARLYSVKDKKLQKTIFATGTLEGFFQLESDVAKELLAALGVKGDTSAAAIGTKNLYAYHQAIIGYELINYQSMSPRSSVRLPVGSIKKAKLHFERALKLDPKYADAYAGLGTAESFLDEHEAARKAFVQAFQMAAGGFQAQAALGKYFDDLRTGRTDDALKGLDQAQKARPGFLHALGFLGQTYNHMGRHREAHAVFERYRQLAPRQPWVLVQLGYTKAKMKKFDAAIADTLRAIEMLPDSTSFQIELASRYIDAEKLELAEGVLRKALDKGARDAKLQLRLGYIYLLQKKLELAVPVLDKALAEAQLSDEPRTRQLVHYDLARCYALKKDIKTALSHLDEAVKNGFKELDELENEPDLDEVRKDPKFQQILDAAKKPAV